MKNKPWDERYREKGYLLGIEPVQFLVEHIHELRKGKALDIAMGEGRNAVYLAKMGWDVDGVEVSEEAVKKAYDLADKKGVKINAIKGDLEKHEHIIEENRYDLISCFYYLQRDLFPEIKRGLRKGGMVIVQTFTIDNLKYQDHPRNPAHVLKHNELLRYFLDFRILFYREAVLNNETAVASIIAERLEGSDK